MTPDWLAFALGRDKHEHRHVKYLDRMRRGMHIRARLVPVESLHGVKSSQVRIQHLLTSINQPVVSRTKEAQTTADEVCHFSWKLFHYQRGWGRGGGWDATPMQAVSRLDPPRVQNAFGEDRWVAVADQSIWFLAKYHGRSGSWPGEEKTARA